MITIGIDPSTKSTGIVVFKDSELIDYEIVKENSKNVLERVDNIIVEIENKIKEYNPDNVVAENVQITMSAPTAKSLMGLQFMIELICYRHNIECKTIRPSSWRKILGLSNSPKTNRKEKKAEAMQYAIDKYGIEIDSDDLSDALCLATAYLIKEEIIKQ